ncbi:hypothetical protein GCM10027169_16440 [Gordonia jinhuaensis]|uniref:HTH tetR-type domain-containing protein n=1 Tax=Gordonia jinhuaensis TaxID=1517702 RepID=A0A916TJL6_9ACTN|nr:TetR/AcrR family transcriptional regulator [Gordonia jinhuaensis]GGB48360.1 hypothetical protein GCM10011489_39370 [Gordonia jinhuaensis]
MAKLPADVRRNQLIEVAIAVASSEGIAAATTRRVAAEAGVAVGVVHYCFGTKELLMREVIRAIVNEILEASIDAPREGDSLRSYLSRAADAYCVAITRNHEKRRLTFELTTYTVRTDSARELGRMQYECYFEAARRFFVRAAEATGTAWIVSVETLARMLVAMSEGMALVWLVDRKTDEMRKVLATFVDQLLALATEAPDQQISTSADMLIEYGER